MTNEPIHCPLCEQPLTQVGAFWICPQHGQVSLEKPFVPMRIFLSYGHDANEELVRRIKVDLEQRGHDVWFDRSEIRFGDDWRREITDGIVGSNRVLSFLSKYSTRDPGVCLDELAIAIGVKGGNIQTVLVESEAEVKAPPSIGHIQWLDMRDWKEQRSIGDRAWEVWYQGRFAEIVRVIESDESRRFAGEIETLNQHLKPISSDSRVSALLRKGFVGRAWLFDAIDQWRKAQDRTSRLFWIVGDPGVGKSAFAAHLTHFGRDKVIAAQFVEWDKPDHRNAQRVVRSLAFQLAARLPDYRKLLLTLPEITDLDQKDPAELFDYVLATPLRSVIDGGRERYLIVIDALDEAEEGGRNPLVEMLARNAMRLPDWIGLVVTSRPERAVTTPLQGLAPFVLDTRIDANRADIRDYLRRELARQLKERPDAGRIVEQILEKSEGVFLYVERICQDIQQGFLTPDRLDQFPQGLGGIFYQFFYRQFPDLEKFRRHVRPALRAIIAAREPLPLNILQRLFNWGDEEIRDFTRSLGSLFPVTNESDSAVIKPYHKSVTDWLGNEEKAGTYFVSMLEGHKILANYCIAALLKASTEIFPIEQAVSYQSAHLLDHLKLTEQWDRIAECFLNKDIFFRISPISYGVYFSRGSFLGSDPRATNADFLELVAPEARARIGWEIAEAFARRARDLLTAANYICCRCGYYSAEFRKTRAYLLEHDPGGFSEFRDIFYTLPMFSGKAAEFAVASFDATAEGRKSLGAFVTTNQSISALHDFLRGFAASDGWSGQLEVIAGEFYRSWDAVDNLWSHQH
jgi:hypothetical protein